MEWLIINVLMSVCFFFLGRISFKAWDNCRNHYLWRQKIIVQTKNALQEIGDDVSVQSMQVCVYNHRKLRCRSALSQLMLWYELHEESRCLRCFVSSKIDKNQLANLETAALFEDIILLLDSVLSDNVELKGLVEKFIGRLNSANEEMKSEYSAKLCYVFARAYDSFNDRIKNSFAAITASYAVQCDYKSLVKIQSFHPRTVLQFQCQIVIYDQCIERERQDFSKLLSHKDIIKQIMARYPEVFPK